MGIRGLWAHLRRSCPQVLRGGHALDGTPTLKGRVFFIDAMLVVTRCAFSIASTDVEALSDAVMAWDAEVRERHQPSEMVYVFDGARLPIKTAWEGRRRQMHFRREAQALDKARAELEAHQRLVAARRERASAEPPAGPFHISGHGAADALPERDGARGASAVQAPLACAVDDVPLDPPSAQASKVTGCDEGGAERRAERRPLLRVSVGGERIAVTAPPLHDEVRQRLEDTRRLESLERDLSLRQSRHAVHVTRDVAAAVAARLSDLLGAIGEPHNVIQAQADAEMACVALASHAPASSTVVTDDGDAVAFGATSVLIHACRDREAVVSAQDAAEALGLCGVDEWRAACAFAGCDYGPHVANIGFATAVKAVSTFRKRMGRSVRPGDPEDWHALLSMCGRAGADRTWLSSLTMCSEGPCGSCGHTSASRFDLWHDVAPCCAACVKAAFLGQCAPALLAEAVTVLAMREEPFMQVVSAGAKEHDGAASTMRRRDAAATDRAVP